MPLNPLNCIRTSKYQFLIDQKLSVRSHILQDRSPPENLFPNLNRGRKHTSSTWKHQSRPEQIQESQSQFTAPPEDRVKLDTIAARHCGRRQSEKVDLSDTIQLTARACGLGGSLSFQPSTAIRVHRTSPLHILASDRAKRIENGAWLVPLLRCFPVVLFLAVVPLCHLNTLGNSRGPRSARASPCSSVVCHQRLPLIFGYFSIFPTPSGARWPLRTSIRNS